MLTKKMMAENVTIKLSSIVQSIEKNDAFKINLDDSAIEATSLVIACGGKSIPKIGASNFGYLIAEQFDLAVIPTRPALVPLVFAHSDLTKTKPLAGMALHASVTCEKTNFEEGFLFTHRGLSGPSILQISSYWQEGKSIDINLCPNVNLFETLFNMKAEFGRKKIETVVSEFLPSRLANIIITQSGITGNLADQSKKNLRVITELIQNWTLKPSGSEGYRTAEVTLGGVNTDELNSKTMESKKVKGLYFIGEVVDVTGWLGGYNFQWAWSSGWVAGNEL
jgi:predicted Rossmann fold flavoprotein